MLLATAGSRLPALDVVPTPVADFALLAVFGPPAIASPVTNGREHKLKGGGVPSPEGLQLKEFDRV